MSRRNINDYPLHLEERCAVIRELANTTLGPLTEEQHRDLMLTIMDIAAGDRRAVPRRLRDMVRVPYKFAWGKPKEGA